jgi:aminoglycoside phosphotransferase (APT) family kinase protein
MRGLRYLDRATAVRPGEALDVERLEQFLRRQLGDFDGRLAVAQFPQGYSNLTYLLRLGERQLVLRRPPFGANIKSAHDMGREYTILSRLIAVYPKVPRPLLYCEDETIIGAPFYLMERVRGVILRPGLADTMAPPAALMARIAGAAVANLAQLHAVDHRAAGLAEMGRPAGYLQRQIEGWSRRYQNARTDDIADMEQTATWLAGHMPAASGAALIHNDYKYDNLVLDPADWSQITAVLDWEMATIGDPLLDLGAALGYWIEADDPQEVQALRFSPTNLPGNPTRTEVVEAYVAASGREVPDPVYYYVYGLFRLAVIIQQIYRRYKLGYTQDARFAGLIKGVRACGLMAQQAIARQRLGGLF